MKEGLNYGRISLYGLVLGVFLALLNELAFRHHSISVVISAVCIGTICVTLLMRRVQWALVLMLFYFMGFATRPREIHLIDLQVRGQYEYYSPNILSFGGPSVTTLLAFVCTIYVFMQWANIRKAKIYQGVLSLSALVAYGTMVTLIVSLIMSDVVALGDYLSDVKYPLFLVAGLGMFALSGMSSQKMVEVLFVLGAALGCAAIIAFCVDEISAKHALQYNHNTYFSIMVLGVAIYWRDKVSRSSLLALFLIGCGAIPLVRGEQLIAAVTLLVTFLFMIRKGSGAGSLLKVALILLFALTFGAYILGEDNALSRFVISKSKFFASLSGEFDHSTLVRSREATAVFGDGSWGSVAKLIFGKGLGSTFSLESVSWLNLADYSRDELAANEFRQPHLFILHWVLKFGLIGSAWLTLWHLKTPRLSRTEYVLYVICLPALLWQAYWAPGFAFAGGVLWALASQSSLAARRSDA